MQASTSQNRPYQGYPYVNPHVVDAPSIDAATAAKWANLPRRKITVPSTPEGTPCVVYVDLPEDMEPNRNQTQAQSSSSQIALPAKVDTEDTPVVYIDMPDEAASGSEVIESRETRTLESTYVDETIFYNPFDDKRINVDAREVAQPSDITAAYESDLESISEVNSPVRIPGPSRPTRPNYINLAGPSGSGPSTSSPIQSVSSGTSILPSGLPSDGYIYNRADGSLNGISSGFPEPPPAYSEIDVGSPQPTIVEQPLPQPTTALPPITPPPRTQVIVPGEPRNMERKYLTCHHCGERVHTLVVKEIGPITHLAGLTCLLICMLPFVCLIYYSDCLKNKNHYCPNCNKVIGYELPMNREKVVYIDN